MRTLRSVILLSNITMNANHSTATYASAGMKLFRFMKPDTEYFAASIDHLICQNEIFLACRNDFNDPFDMHPILECDWTIPGIRKHMQNIAANPLRAAATPEVIAQYLATAPSRMPRVPLTTLRKIKERFIPHMTHYLDEIGVCCFTEEMQNPLFWAHYAGSYAGICAEFTAKADTSHPFCNCMKVQYSEHRPVIRASQVGGLSTVYTSPDMDYVVQYGFCLKSHGWAVEREWRVWIPGRARNYQSLPPRTLSTIFIGPLADDSTLKAVTALVRKSSNPIKVFNTRLSERDFKVDVGKRLL